MKKCGKKLIMPCVVFGILFFTSACVLQDKTDVKKISSPKGSYQLSQTYPIKATDEAFDSSLLTNQMASFYGYEGQGELLLKTNDKKAFKIYVNGEEVFADLSNQKWQQVDISEFTKNGDNNLQVSQVENNNKAKMNVKVPYPVLKDKTEDYTENDNFKLIDQLINAEIKNGFTSAQLVVTKNGKIVKSSAYGNISAYDLQGNPQKDGKKVTENTLYDLASNTKMYATNYAIQKLVSDGDLAIDQKVSDFFPDFKDKKSDKIKGKNELTVKEILEHQAGFPADPQYHNKNYDPDADDLSSPDANKKLYTQDRNEVMEKIIATPLEYEPGTKTMYSDVDYMLLGFIIEQVTGQRLDKYMSKNYYQPLKLQHTTFNPLEHNFTKEQIAATEIHGNTRDGAIDFDNIRENTVQGEVHDEKAFYSMGGISGHAGLFANAKDLAVLTQITLNRGGYGDQQFFDEDTMDQFIKAKDTDPSFGLGWRRKGQHLYSWAFSPLADTSTIGHTGWTGTLTVIDPINHMSVILLTNTKNSPVIDNKEDPNDFVGDHFLTGQYGLIATLAFDSHKKDNSAANNAKLVDMVIAKYRYMKANKKDQTSADYAQLQSLLDVVNERKNSKEIIDFMKTKQFKQMNEFVSNG
ncbi:penicillin binding protein PBP4B [Tetragenococcus koreensis]|uniref:Penicillin binding protein PBP4B n=1 Tax=Tetragenococcus solitarius TaxID=71453 RepID=A0ABP6KJQ1_9ENTE|nr:MULTISPECIES: penicillin binding protein PBP4B [Tetragenococcus]MCF1586032.1 penicillin binding protein PBP4B [Tetragenococcus koreensis]MCF1615621.1 penicillin binding protein PBP4B [Tetragenococcus koreensis]MCF1620670.1 penicillin binding protein PBP4B [Tetragenococcus koreensis]MCF1625417.1 penicillin binding protein PBP4B [Tetragenococcus koreensis]MCF1630280.1 penicillin binding protein PBP4B [Tetragenococcus koreensis]